MPVLDFTEMPEAHTASGEQDSFEMFARELLAHLGYRIVGNPNRGADGGKDLIAEEKRVGVGGESIIKWLVSCKHKAHSGNSVRPADESNIRDRVESNACQGFLGFYSTLPSSGLTTKIDGLKHKLEAQVFDKEIIESHLLRSSDGIEIAKRYFPVSIKKWQTENPEPIKIFSEEPQLVCAYCGKDLLKPKFSGIIVCWEKIKEDYVEEVYWCCKGHCDKALLSAHLSRGKEIVDGWKDIPDIIIPHMFIKWVIVTLNELKDGTRYSDAAFAKLKEFLLNIYPFVARDLTTDEEKRLGSLMQIPSHLGGLGY